jgi:hypothetical protein
MEITHRRRGAIPLQYKFWSVKVLGLRNNQDVPQGGIARWIHDDAALRRQLFYGFAVALGLIEFDHS